jgi:hypothetical protein
VNSVAPGQVWGDSLKWYFGHLAKQRDVTVEERRHHRGRAAAYSGPRARGGERLVLLLW